MAPPSPPPPPHQEGWRAVSPSGSRLVRGDQGAAGSLRAPLPRVLLGQGSAQHAPGPSFYWDAPSRSGTLCNAACDPLGQSRSTTDHTPRAPLWGSVVGGRKLQVTRPTDPLSSLVVGHPCPAAGARSTGHTQPPTRANHDPQENDKRCAPALKAPPPPQRTPHGTRAYTYRHGGISLSPAP